MVWTWDNTYQWEGKDPNMNINFAKYHADDDFTGTIGLEITAGRDIDVSKYPGDSTAILLNETAVKQMAFKDPIGQQLQSQEGNWRVVGVVKDFLPGNAFGKADPMVIQGPGPKHWFGTITFRLSENNSVSNSLSVIEKVFRKYDPEYPFVYEFTDDMFASQFSSLERYGKLAAISSGLTIFISCLGLFALAAYVIEGRFREIGIRKVMGASTFSITALLSRDFLKLVLVAILFGSPIAWWSMNSWLGNFPYRVNISPALFLFTGAAALVISMLTICFQSIRAALANPAKSLRRE
jgi:ABC-type antimicrobial peptide transport system permease subunit